MRADEQSGSVAAGFFSRRPDPLQNPAPLIRQVYAYVAYRIGDGHDAEDVTSEVFERAVRYRSTYEPSKGDPVGWLIGIARRTLADRLERRVPIPTDSPVGADEDADLETATILRLTLDKAIARLSERDQDLLSLRYGADLKARQIAALMEIETHAVEVALARAVGRLRELLGEDRP